MQKINVALLIAIDGLIERVIRRAPTFQSSEFHIVPMLCWWPAGQIQSERPTGVIKVPVFYLHQPEVAFFLIIHELGQLIAFEYDGEKPVSTTYTKADFEKMAMDGPLIIGTEQDAESLGVDTGKFITDLRADVFLLRAGFANDVTRMHRFLLDQFLLLIESEHGLSLLSVRCAHILARMICVSAAAAKFKAVQGGEATGFRLTKSDRAQAAKSVWDYLIHELHGRPNDETNIATDLLDPAVLVQGESFAGTYHEWVEEAMRYVDEMVADADAAASSVDCVKQGFLTPIDDAQITSYFRAILSMKEDGADAQSLFRARAALISSILGYCTRQPRLEQTT